MIMSWPGALRRKETESIKVTIEKNPALLSLCFVSFSIRHVGYGLGSLFALPRTLLSYGFWKNRITRKCFSEDTAQPIARKAEIE